MSLAEVTRKEIISEDVRSDEIVLTESAADAIRALLDERKLENHALRVFIAGGGCSGYQYGMALEGEARDNDLTISQHGVNVVIDDVSLNYLRGATIDFVNEVIPELQKRGLFRTAYEGKTLRENLGLSRPENRFFAAATKS